MKRIGLLLAVCLLGGYWHWRERPVEYNPGPGIQAPRVPVQAAVSGPAPRFEKEGFALTALARFEVEARVLRREDYRFDTEAALAPVDLALGWGRMSDSAVLAHFEITQGNRFYYWRTQEFPIPRREVETSSANMHMIPASPTVERQLKAVRAGQIVRFSGYLIEAQRPDGWYWRSSLTRDDTGAGACEVVWVEALEVF